MKQTHILGISAFYHDSAAAIVRDGEILAAAQEERFSRDDMRLLRRLAKTYRDQHSYENDGR